MKYCTLRPWYRIKSDIQMIAVALGQMLLVVYGAVTLVMGLITWIIFFDTGMSPDTPMWVEFIRLSWYFWVPAIVLKLTHMLVCEEN